MRFLIILIFFISSIYANEKYETSKTSCVQQSNYSGKTLDEIKKILIEQSKRESIEELYGSLILSKTTVENGKLVNDEIKQKAVGAVRIKGNPKFYNGKNLGEICSDINAYITKKDLEKYSPKAVNLDKFCFNDPTVPMNKIKDEAKLAAYKEIISQYNPSLNIQKEKRAQYIHEFKISNDKFDFDTASYCFQATAKIMPYELELDNRSNKNIIVKKTASTKKSTIVTGKGTKSNPYVLPIVNQKIKFKKSNSHKWYKFTLEEEQIVYYYELDTSISDIRLYSKDFKQLNLSGGIYTNTLEVGTYYLEVNGGSKPISSFNILFGSSLDMTNIHGYKKELEIRNQEIKFKRNKNFVWYKFKLDKTQPVKYHEINRSINAFYLYDNELTLLSSQTKEHIAELDAGTYYLKTNSNWGKGPASFEIAFSY